MPSVKRLSSARCGGGGAGVDGGEVRVLGILTFYLAVIDGVGEQIFI